MHWRLMRRDREKLQSGHILHSNRFDHATKHVFIIPGLILATLCANRRSTTPWSPSSLVSPAQLPLHRRTTSLRVARSRIRCTPPSKQGARRRTVVALPFLVYCEYAASLRAGLARIAARHVFLLDVRRIPVVRAYLQVPPVRSKDLPYVDVVSESVTIPSDALAGR